jgi:putative NIF3 family GTP cyclohydrolase 1 type 2
LKQENEGEILEIYTGVDLCNDLLDKCSDKSLIIVRLGFSAMANPLIITKGIYQLSSRLIKKDCALYEAPLALSIHKEFGDNFGFYKLTGWDKYMKEPFGLTEQKEQTSGVVEFPHEFAMSEIMEVLYEFFGRELLFWDFGKKKIKRLAFIAGMGLYRYIDEIMDKELDLFITGDTSHGFYWNAKDNKVNVAFAGHYNTKTIGLKLLGEHLSRKFRINHRFIDLPTVL